MVDYLENAPELWDEVVNRAFKIKEVIQPLQNQNADKIKGEIAGFKTVVGAFRSEFRAKSPFEGRGSVADAYALMDKCVKWSAPIGRDDKCSVLIGRELLITQVPGGARGQGGGVRRAGRARPPNPTLVKPHRALGQSQPLARRAPIRSELRSILSATFTSPTVDFTGSRTSSSSRRPGTRSSGTRGAT